MKNCRFYLKVSLILTILVSITACNKEYKSDQNSRVATVNSLNTGDNDQVIKKLSSKSNSEDDTFYLASALASKGGLDIYSMYPILEVKLFHESAMNWSNISKESSGLKIMKKRKASKLETKEDREQLWSDSEEKLKRKFRVDKNFDCSQYELYNQFCNDFMFQANTKVKDTTYQLTLKKVQTYEGLKYEEYTSLADEILGFEMFSNHSYGPEEISYEEKNILREIFSEAFVYNQQVYDYELAKQKFISPPKLGDLTQADAPLVLMNVLLATYEAIPLLQSLPTISSDDQKYVTRSLNELIKLTSSPKYKKKASTFLYSLSLFSLLSVYSNSFDFDKVNSPMDLYCQFKPEVLADNYEVIRARFDILLTHGKEAFLPKEYLEKFEENYQMFKNSPKTFAPEAKKEFISKMRGKQESDCSIESIL